MSEINNKSIEDMEELSFEEISELQEMDDEETQEYKPELSSFNDIEHVGVNGAEAHFLPFDFAPTRLDHIVRVDENSELMTEVREQAKFNDQIVYPYTRDEKGRSDDETEEQKSADATISEVALAQHIDAETTDETKHDYDCDVVTGDGLKVDVKTTNIHSKGYNIPIRRYGMESVRDSLTKKNRDYLVQSYSIRKNGFLYIGFEFAFDPKTAMQKYDPEDQHRNKPWAWYNNDDGLKTWRTLKTENMNMHLFNAKTARADEDITRPIESLKTDK
jgi:hypothetical protein